MSFLSFNQREFVSKVTQSVGVRGSKVAASMSVLYSCSDKRKRIRGDDVLAQRARTMTLPVSNTVLDSDCRGEDPNSITSRDSQFHGFRTSLIDAHQEFLIVDITAGLSEQLRFDAAVALGIHLRQAGEKLLGKEGPDIVTSQMGLEGVTMTVIGGVEDLVLGELATEILALEDLDLKSGQAEETRPRNTHRLPPKDSESCGTSTTSSPISFCFPKRVALRLDGIPNQHLAEDGQSELMAATEIRRATTEKLSMDVVQSEFSVARQTAEDPYLDVSRSREMSMPADTHCGSLSASASGSGTISPSSGTETSCPRYAGRMEEIDAPTRYSQHDPGGRMRHTVAGSPNQLPCTITRALKSFAMKTSPSGEESRPSRRGRIHGHEMMVVGREDRDTASISSAKSSYRNQSSIFVALAPWAFCVQYYATSQVMKDAKRAVLEARTMLILAIDAVLEVDSPCQAKEVGLFEDPDLDGSQAKQSRRFKTGRENTHRRSPSVIPANTTALSSNTLLRKPIQFPSSTITDEGRPEVATLGFMQQKTVTRTSGPLGFEWLMSKTVVKSRDACTATHAIFPVMLILVSTQKKHHGIVMLFLGVREIKSTCIFYTTNIRTRSNHLVHMLSRNEGVGGHYQVHIVQDISTFIALVLLTRHPSRWLCGLRTVLALDELFIKDEEPHLGEQERDLRELKPNNPQACEEADLAWGQYLELKTQPKRTYYPGGLTRNPSLSSTPECKPQKAGLGGYQRRRTLAYLIVSVRADSWSVFLTARPEFFTKKLGPRKAEHLRMAALSRRETAILNVVQDKFGLACQILENPDLRGSQFHRLANTTNTYRRSLSISTSESTTVSESLRVRMPSDVEGIGRQYQRPHLFIDASTAVISTGKTFGNWTCYVVGVSSKEDPPKVAKPETVSTRASTIEFGSPKIDARAVVKDSPPGEEGPIRGHGKVVDARPVMRMFTTNAVLISFLCRPCEDPDLGYGQCKTTRPRTTHRFGAQDSKAQRASSKSSLPSFPRQVRCDFDGGTNEEHFQIQKNESSQRVVGLVPSHKRAPASAPEHIRGHGSRRKAKPHGKRTRNRENRAHCHGGEDKERRHSHAGQTRDRNDVHCTATGRCRSQPKITHSRLGFYGIVTKSAPQTSITLP
ncbi:hypothetical protein BDZ89DRAFT_1054751 [Hymenopellis radicata]|nr:hypothetical protein BDZ89DRAFT_1054751 [Hymenopellis radicata]